MTETFNQLYSKYNTDDVFNRVVIIGLLDLLNHKLKYNQVWDDNVVEEVTVPFMYDFGSSDERFAQDNYAFFGTTCFNEKKITGKFDMLPRGVVKYTSSSIDSGNITNRFVRGSFLKNENGKLTSYTGDMYSIPLSFNFECELWIDNMITAFKIEQAIRETFYKNKSFYVLFRGMKISCCAGFPEQTSIDKNASYAFDSERQIKMTFSLAVETYQPVFDNTTIIESTKRIEHIGFDVELPNPQSSRGEIISKIKITNNFNKLKVPAGVSIPISWTSSSECSDIPRIAISYIDNTTGDERVLDIVNNSGNYTFNISDTFAVYDQPIIVFNDQDLIIDEPVIKILPDNKEITNESFIVVNPGNFNVLSGTMPITIEVLNPDGSITLNENYSVNISNGSIDLTNPISINGDTLKVLNSYEPKDISIKIYNPVNKEIFDKTGNLLIF